MVAREQHLVGARREHRSEQRAASDLEAAENVGERAFKVMHRMRPGIECGKRVDQHELAVEPLEMIDKERPHHEILVGLVAPPHHRPERALRAFGDRQIERRECQRRRVFEIAWHQETPGRQHAHRKLIVAAGAQIIREQTRGLDRVVLVG